MAFDFPTSPTNGQEYTSGSVTYVFNGTGWGVKPATVAGDYVLKTGDTMTGSLKVTALDPSFTANKTTLSGHESIFAGQTNGVTRWYMVLGTNAAETGGNVGSDFALCRVADNGAFLSVPLSINRATGRATFNNGLDVWSSLSVYDNRLYLSRAQGQDHIQMYNQSTGHNRYIRMADATIEFVNHEYSAVVASIENDGRINGNRFRIPNGAEFGDQISRGWYSDSSNNASRTNGSLYVQSISGGVTYARFGSTAEINANTAITGSLTVSSTLGVSGAITAPSFSGYVSSGSSTGSITGAGTHGLECRSAGAGHAAFMAMHMPGAFAGNIGIDTDNIWKIGGWSHGGSAWKIFHEGICPNNGQYFKLTSGLMFVYGETPSGGDQVQNFPIAFPSVCLGVLVTFHGDVGGGGAGIQMVEFHIGWKNQSGFYKQGRYLTNGTMGIATQPGFYIAYGY